MEIERKFLINEMPVGLDEFEHKKIKQGYFSINPEKRVRLLENEYTLICASHKTLRHKY